MGALDDAADLLVRTSNILTNEQQFVQKQILGEVYDALVLLGQPAVDHFNGDLQRIVALTDEIIAEIHSMNERLKSASVLVRAGRSIFGA